MTKSCKGWVLVGTAILLVPAPALAQDTGSPQDIGTTTPPELRDFRLDTPPPRPAPQQTPPQPETSATTPPPADRQQTAPERSAASEPQRRSPAPQAERHPQPVADTAATETPLQDVPESVIDAAPPAIADSLPEAEAAPVAAGDSTSEAQFPAPFWIGVAIAALLAALASALWRRRKLQAHAEQAAELPILQPSPPARLEKRTPPVAPPLPKQPASQSPVPDSKASMDAAFKPQTAQLSIASLSITGTLTLVNRGDAPVDQLLLRSHMISAQTGQQDAIAAFHHSKSAGSLQALGSLATGERIDAVIEIRLPRNELESFRWTEREFVAPIILFNLSGLAKDENIEVRLAQLIGREGNRTSARMKPLAVDRGPKRFTGISARPLFA
ncbi:MAG: hypothetical protein IPG54_13120 [Sphingomonadales bacterium]|nr:hypothetical protein [Sphingomonadales bacterium]MBK9269808.1 hypothetical protein [Sphingomonadales bacterium]MBP6434389.1 hypothetical protein [Sphingorhabdus sp.]